MKYISTILILVGLLSQIVLSAVNVDFTILGVIASSNKGEGIALIKNKKTGKVSAFRSGQKIDKKTLIKKIERKTVSFEMNGKSYNMRVGDDNPSETVTAEKSSIADNLQNANGIERNGNKLRISKRFERKPNR